MAAELITPVDDLSGLPLPILPGKRLLPTDRPEIADWHHHFHPKEHPLLKTTGGLALRNCRVQLVHRNFHNESPTRYHRFYAGPELPTEESEQFKLVVLACAGFIPDEAVDLRSGEPKITRMSEKQSRLLRLTLRPSKSTDQGCSGEKGHSKAFLYRNLRYGYEPIREFLSEYSLGQNIDHVPEPLIDEFLFTQNRDRKRYLGHLLLAKKIEVASECAEEKYKAARDAALLHPLMPAHPNTLVKHKLGRTEKRETLFPRLAAQLALAKGLSGLTIRGERAII